MSGAEESAAKQGSPGSNFVGAMAQRYERRYGSVPPLPAPPPATSPGVRSPAAIDVMRMSSEVRGMSPSRGGQQGTATAASPQQQQEAADQRSPPPSQPQGSPPLPGHTTPGPAQKVSPTTCGTRAPHQQPKQVTPPQLTSSVVSSPPDVSALYGIAVASLGSASTAGDPQPSKAAQAAFAARQWQDRQVRNASAKMQIENTVIQRDVALVSSPEAADLYGGATGVGRGLSAGDEFRLFAAMRHAVHHEEDPDSCEGNGYRLHPLQQRRLDYEGQLIASPAR